MARTVAVANRKGGVGKTTTALNLAHGLRLAGKRVLLVDLDEQHNSTRLYGARIEGAATVFDLLTDRRVDPRLAVQPGGELGDIIAGDDLIVRASEQMAAIDCREFMLVDALEPIAHEYDFIVIDCPPTLGIVTKNALVAADEVIAPVNADDYSMDGFGELVEQVEAIRADRRLNPGLGQVRALLTIYDGRTRGARSRRAHLAEEAAARRADSFSTVIRRCVRTDDAQRLNVPLLDYYADCTTARDYRAFVGEFLASQPDRGATAHPNPGPG